MALKDYKDQLLEYWSIPFPVPRTSCTRITLMIGIAVFMSLYALPNESFWMKSVYAAFVAVSFGVGCFLVVYWQERWGQQWFHLEKQTVGTVWILSLISFVLGYVIFHLVHISIFPRFYDTATDWKTLIFLMLPIWFLIGFLHVQSNLKRLLNVELERLQAINIALEAQDQTNPMDESIPPPLMETKPIEFQPLEVAVSGNVKMVSPETITHITVEEHYSQIFVKDQADLKSIEVRAALKDMLSQLPAELFVQIHRSHAVNLAHIGCIRKSAASYQVAISDTAVTLPISRHRIPSVLPRLEQFHEK